MRRQGMTRWWGRIVMAMLVLPVASRAQTPVTAFVDVTVIPMDRERLVPHQTVVVQGGRITAVGATRKVRIPPGAKRIDGRGKFLMPGLSDMHTHVGLNETKDAERVLFLLFAAGVTTIRNVDFLAGSTLRGPPDRTSLTNADLLRFKAQAAAGELWSPRIYTSGRWYTDSTKSIFENVAAYKAAGFDHIKLYYEDSITVDSVAVAARRVGIPIVGHSARGEPVSGLTRSIAVGQKSIEHLGAYFPKEGGPAAGLDSAGAAAWRADSLALPALVAATVRAGIWNCPGPLDADMGTYPNKLEWYQSAEAALALHTPLAVQMQKMPAGESPDTLSAYGRDDFLTRKHYYYVIKALYDAGAGLLDGTDTNPGSMHGTPGSATHRSLQALVVRAGLTPYQALAISTRNAARYLGIEDSAGTVAVGKRADLVLLDGNPLQDIVHIGQTAGVMVGGRWMGWADIKRRLDAYYADVIKP